MFPEVVVAWFIGQSLVFILLAFVLGVIAGRLSVRPPKKAFINDESERTEEIGPTTIVRRATGSLPVTATSLPASGTTPPIATTPQPAAPWTDKPRPRPRPRPRPADHTADAGKAPEKADTAAPADETGTKGTR
ncbi:hypothetical protein [Actinoplanes sp. CA-252034]|uniref:hypothetical protein n=1 Tax=Actinoplanes sp. CA-252034 TaxID=3239906 RepID=UPI003D96DFF9